jgi:predicted enzyme related to lactoylglutathione lyase
MSHRVRAHRELGISVLLLLLAAAAAGCHTTSQEPHVPLQLPPLQQPPSNEHHPGKIIWVELVTPDLAGAQHFYGELFGWTFQNVPGARVPLSIALNGGEPVAGFVQPRTPHSGRRQPAWLPFIAASNVTGAEQQALAHGAHVVAIPRSYPKRGEQAVFSDPQGAVFGVLQSSSGDPPDELADPGQWIWAALLTTDPKRAALFYQTLFGYDVEPLPGQDSGSHWLLSSEGFARATANTPPPHSKREPPYWLPFVRVLDAKTAVEKVKSLGGSVLSEPHPDRDGGTAAVVTDPAGTPFGLLEWQQEPPAATPEPPQ